MTFETFISLPGIGCDDRITVSLRVRVSQRESLLAISDRADMGSPWEPVEMMQTWPGS